MPVKTFEFTKIVGREKIEFGDPVLIDDFVFIYARKRMRIGSFVHIGCFSSITGGEEFEMGDFSGLSGGVRVYTGSDDFAGWGFGNPTIPEKYRNVHRAPIRIGRFAIVGANSVVLPGVTIGEGACVAACSVVSRDAAPWGVYAGNKRIGERDRDGVLAGYEAFLHELGSESA
jgi:galactoside O-acetyltransferase